MYPSTAKPNVVVLPSCPIESVHGVGVGSEDLVLFGRSAFTGRLRQMQVKKSNGEASSVGRELIELLVWKNQTP